MFFNFLDELRSAGIPASIKEHLLLLEALLTLLALQAVHALLAFLAVALHQALAVLAFLGNVFIPMEEGSAIYRIAQFTPMFGVAEICRAPLTRTLNWTSVLNAVAWFSLFAIGAAWRMSRDTARV